VIDPTSALTHAIAVLAIVVVIAVIVVGKLDRTRQERSRKATASIGSYDDNSQLARVSAAQFAPQPLMNKGEYAAFRIAESIVRAQCPGYRVFAQVSLGEVLRCDDRAAYGAINAKRTDLLIIDSAGIGVLAIECQGSGHYQKHAPMRDAVKKEALRQAGIRTLEIDATDNARLIEHKIKIAYLLNPVGGRSVLMLR